MLREDDIELNISTVNEAFSDDSIRQASDSITRYIENITGDNFSVFELENRFDNTLYEGFTQLIQQSFLSRVSSDTSLIEINSIVESTMIGFDSWSYDLKNVFTATSVILIYKNMKKFGGNMRKTSKKLFESMKFHNQNVDDILFFLLFTEVQVLKKF